MIRAAINFIYAMAIVTSVIVGLRAYGAKYRAVPNSRDEAILASNIKH